MTHPQVSLFDDLSEENPTPPQVSLFGDPPEEKPAIPKENGREKDISALDGLFLASKTFRNTETYLKLLAFIGRFRKHAPFNCALLYTQNPAVSYVATASEWKEQFGRIPKVDARPLVILWPFSPVLFVYDLAETEGKSVPEELLRPFRTEGKLLLDHWNFIIHNCKQHHGIAVREVVLAHQHAGSAMRLTAPFQDEYKRLLKDEPNARYLILLKRDAKREDQFTTLAHELAHIFLGHCGKDPKDWWEPRLKLSHDQREIEAESVAFLVSKRLGLDAASHEYLSNYQKTSVKELPELSLDAICNVTAYVESLCKTGFRPKKPKVPQLKPSKK